MKEPRFWIDDEPYFTRPLDGWVGVVDEERGGIIAYFGKIEDAEKYIYYKTAFEV